MTMANQKARCNLCPQGSKGIIKNADRSKIKNHYKEEHGINPLGKCGRCGDREILVEKARNSEGNSVAIQNLYCSECIGNPLEELLIKKVADLDN